MHDPKGLWYSVVDVCTCLVIGLRLNCLSVKKFCQVGHFKSIQQKFASDPPRIGRNLVYTYVAVTGRNQTLFLSICDHFFDVRVFVTMS